jgi:hypothetical protein
MASATSGTELLSRFFSDLPMFLHVSLTLPGTDILLFLLTAGIVVSAEIAAMRAQ